MEFRWVALITLWTMVAGPMFDSPSAPARGARVRTAAVSSESRTATIRPCSTPNVSKPSHLPR